MAKGLKIHETTFTVKLVDAVLLQNSTDGELEKMGEEIAEIMDDAEEHIKALIQARKLEGFALERK